MSDHRERACPRCGSLLHHEDVCPNDRRPRLPRACVRCGSYYHYTENCDQACWLAPPMGREDTSDFRSRFDAFCEAELIRFGECEFDLDKIAGLGASEQKGASFLFAAILYESIRKARKFIRKDELVGAVDGIWDMVENDERQGSGEVGSGEPQEKKST